MIDCNSRGSPWMSRYPTFGRGRELLSLVCFDLWDMSSFCGCAHEDLVLVGYDAVSLHFLLPNFRKHLFSKCPRKTESARSCQQCTKWPKLYATANQASDILVTKSEILILVSSRMQDRTWSQARPAYCFPSTVRRRGRTSREDNWRSPKKVFSTVQEVWNKQFRLFVLAYTAATFVTAATWNTDVVSGGNNYGCFNVLFVGLPTKVDKNDYATSPLNRLHGILFCRRQHQNISSVRTNACYDFFANSAECQDVTEGRSQNFQSGGGFGS